MLLRPGSAARRLAAPRPQPPPGPIIFRCGGVMRNAPAFLDGNISRPPSNVGGEPGGTARLRLGRGAVASPSASLLFEGGTRNEERPGLRLPQGLGLRGAAPRCTGPAPGLASLGRRLPTRAMVCDAGISSVSARRECSPPAAASPACPLYAASGSPRAGGISPCAARTACPLYPLRGSHGGHGRSRAAPPALAGLAAHHPIMTAQHATSRRPSGDGGG